jgi:hypothetical protein
MAEEFEQPIEYPRYVQTAEQKRRWRASIAAAEKFAAQSGGDATSVWLATRSLYKSDIPTGGEPETGDPSDG